MNNIQFNFDQMIRFAKEYGLPAQKKRAIVREALQVKILDALYSQKESIGFYFVGGTSLRLLRGLDRFSEDMDFDVVNLTQKQVHGVVVKITTALKKENFHVDLYQNITAKREYFELKFRGVLQEVGVKAEKGEKLAIKIDCENFWQGLKQKTILIKKYGIVNSVVTVPLDQILVEKLTAYLKRRETQPRDVYDIIWLVAQGAKVDATFLSQNVRGLGVNSAAEMLRRVRAKYIREKKKLGRFKLKLKPFLIHESNVNKLDLFEKVIGNC